MAETTSITVELDAPRETLDEWSLNPHLHPMEGIKGYRGHFIDKQKRDFIDFHAAGGANLLGYGYRCVTKAIVRQARRFTGLGLPFPEVWELIPLLLETIPGAEGIRLGKNGTDVTSGAVRLARAFTARERVLHHGYHGFQDWWMAGTACRGIPEALRPLTVTLAELTPEAVDAALRRHPDEFACLIMDPMVPPWAEAETVREIAAVVHRHGALLIFDEVVSGFRVAPGGAQQAWGVLPDLSCFGKSIANGMPLSVLAGRERVMKRLPETNYGMTFECEAISIAAALATVREVLRRDVCGALNAMGRQVRLAYADAARECGLKTALIGADARPYLRIDAHGALSGRELRWLLIQELARAGIMTQGSLTFCFSHTPRDLRALTAALRGALGQVRTAVDRGSVQGMLDEHIREALQ